MGKKSKEEDIIYSEYEERRKFPLALVVAVIIVVCTVIFLLLPSSWFEEKENPLREKINSHNRGMDINEWQGKSDELFSFVNTIQIEDLSFEWFDDIYIDDIIMNDNTQVLKLYSDSESWSYITKFVRSGTDRHSRVVVYDLEFLGYIGEDTSTLVCAFDEDRGIENNIVVLRDMGGQFPDTYMTGDKIVTSSLVSNIRVQEIDGVDVMYMLSSSKVRGRQSGQD